MAAAEGCIASNLGLHLELPSGAGRLDRLLFAEGGARILVSVSASQKAAWQQALDQAQRDGQELPAQYLGVVHITEELSISQSGTTVLKLPISQLRDTFEQAIPRRMGADLPPTV